MSIVIDLTNIQQLCRICLDKTPNLSSLFTSFCTLNGDTSDTRTFIDVLFILTSQRIESEQGFPIGICTNCKELVKSAFELKTKLERSTDILKRFLSNRIEEECQGEENIDKVELVDEICHNDDDDDDDDAISDSSLSDLKQVIEEKIRDATVEHKKDNEILHPCPICTVELPALKLREHAHTHKALKKYLSVPKVSSGTMFYGVPRKTVSLFNRPEILHKCPFCNKMFAVKEFRTHVDNHSKHDEFKCDKCDRVFRKINHLNIHRVKHMKEYPYKCDICQKGFVIKKNFDCHMLIHAGVELPHECKYCLKRFSNPEHLHRHQFIHTENVSYGLKYKVIKCTGCLKTFKDKDQLKCHTCKPVHRSTGGNYRCKICLKHYKHSSGLYNHIRIAHDRKATKTLCSVCGSYVSNIYNHMLSHSGAKPFKCDQCDKMFAYRTALRQHLLVHSGEKPFVCSLCAKAFNNLYNLQVHERIHTGNRCHVCNICNKGFLEKSYLRKHMNVHKNLKS